MPRQLFRQEAIDAQREKFLGEATIARPVPFWVFTLLAAGVAFLLIAVAIWGQYTRRERVEGYLALDTGAARVMSPDAGRITELHREGRRRGAGRATSSRRSRSSAPPSRAPRPARPSPPRCRTAARASRRSRSSGATSATQQVEQARRRVKDLENELTQIDREMKLQETRVKSTRDQAERYNGARRRKKFVSDAHAEAEAGRGHRPGDQAAGAAPPARAGRARPGRGEDGGAADRAAARAAGRPGDAPDQRAAAKDLSQVEARRETVIRAPMAGVVTNIAVNRGQSIAADAPLATVLPKGSGLHVELLVPTRAIGFVSQGPGSRAALRGLPLRALRPVQAASSPTSAATSGRRASASGRSPHASPSTAST